MVEHMDLWMCKFSDLVEQNITTTHAHNRFTPGSGAAGGLGYAFLMFLNGKLLPGADIVIRETGLEEHIKATDIVIVGEGKMDSQSTMGKIPYAIAKLAKKYDKKVIAFAGITEDEELLYKTGLFDAIYTVDRNDMSIEEAMVTENAINNLTQTSKKCFMIKLMGTSHNATCPFYTNIFQTFVLVPYLEHLKSKSSQRLSTSS